MIPEAVQEIAAQIGVFFLRKNNNDYEAARKEILELRISEITYENPPGDVAISLSRPGLLIGRRGEQIDSLTKFLGKQIKIVEVNQSLHDYLLPYDYSQWEN